MSQFYSSNKVADGQAGMTLLEVIFAIMILLIITVTSASLIRNGVDLQLSLSENAKVSHKMALAMTRLNQDLEHAFVLNRKRDEVFYTSRKMKTHFSIKTRGGDATLMLSTLSQNSIRENEQVSDQAFILYKVEVDNDTGVKQLRRGQAKYLPSEYRDNLDTEVLVNHIKSFKIRGWNGSSFEEEWNTEKSDWRDTLPHMVEVTIEIYDAEPFEGERFDDMGNQAFSTMRSVIYLPLSIGQKQRKDPSSQPKYY